MAVGVTHGSLPIACTSVPPGKNKRLSKGGKKGVRKRVVDPMSKKDWYDVVAPACFQTRQPCKTLVNRTAGLRTAADGLKGRVFEVSLADLTEGDESLNYRKMKLQVMDVRGRSCLTNFCGMDMTTDKLRSLFRKWVSMVEAVVDERTTDGYVLRFFCIGFTKRRPNQVRKNCHAKSSQVRQIRARMVDVIKSTVSKSDLQGLVKKLTMELMGKEIEKTCNQVFPMTNVFIRKVKMLRAPKFEVGKLMEAHGGDIPASSEEVGKEVAP